MQMPSNNMICPQKTGKAKKLEDSGTQKVEMRLRLKKKINLKSE